MSRARPRGARAQFVMARPRASRLIENAARRLGFVRIAGADEVGRGCLAGPVVAASVILPPDVTIRGVRDSKQTTAAQRRLFDEIVAAELGGLEPSEIDRVNIARASLEAMRQRCCASIAPRPGVVDAFPSRTPRWRSARRPRRPLRPSRPRRFPESQDREYRRCTSRTPATATTGTRHRRRAPGPWPVGCSPHRRSFRHPLFDRMTSAVGP
jgi:hypothetical protein